MGSDCLCNGINISMTKSVRLTVALRIINLCMSGLTYMWLWAILWHLLRKWPQGLRLQSRKGEKERWKDKCQRTTQFLWPASVLSAGLSMTQNRVKTHNMTRGLTTCAHMPMYACKRLSAQYKPDLYVIQRCYRGLLSIFLRQHIASHRFMIIWLPNYTACSCHLTHFNTVNLTTVCYEHNCNSKSKPVRVRMHSKMRFQPLFVHPHGNGKYG